MSLSKAKLLAAASSLAMLPISSFAADQTMFVNGSIWTANDELPTAEAVVIEGDTITFVGTEADARTAAPVASVVDLNGQMLMPGFHDTHIHTDWVAAAIALKCDLSGKGTPEDVAAVIRACDAELPEGEWLIGSGWALGAFEDAAPSREFIDSILPDRPFFAVAEDGHNGWANSKGFEMAGITKDTPDPENGWILHTEDGELQGTLREYAMFLFDDHIPVYDADDYAVAYREFMKAVNEKGITTVIDPWGTADNLGYATEVLEAGDATVRINFAMYVDPAYDGDLSEYSDWFAPEGDWIQVDQIKYWLDGVYEAQTAATTEEYVGLGHKGKLFYDTEKLKDWTTQFEKMGYSIHMHAIGDRAVKQALDVLEHSRDSRGAETNNRPYLAHGYHIDPADFDRIKAADATVNMTMLWRQNNDSMVYLNKPYLTKEIYESLMPAADVIDAGINFAGGSDSPVGQLNPLASIEVAVTGDVVPYFEGGYFWENQETWAGRKVALEDMLKAYTIWAAVAEGDQDRLGSLEVGKKADLIVLEHDLFEIDPHSIYETKVTKTIVDGKVVFERKGSL
ncbi:hypothetical protein BXY66_3730 [Shimia isoporae]|uniref:Amidohydrolase 3 domain-containing protein n=1 Tax=Shimia isoporae TaxID=647720 RepID=A0A4R1N3F1_9RHOB|nr:amidohydrolase [Shimia isoporae]TCL00022.1 hypothetical protein BXY66_3730 [Shimia isoporae]